MTPLEVLKNKEQGIMLYSPCYGDVKFLKVDNDDYPIEFEDEKGHRHAFTAEGKVADRFTKAQVMLFPSVNLKDWDKFAFKKGDILEHENGMECVEFIEYETSEENPANNYTMFKGKIILPEEAKGNIDYFTTWCFKPTKKAKNKPLYYVALTKGVLADDACIVPSMGMCYDFEMKGIKNMKVCCGQEVVTIKLYRKRKKALSFIRGFVAGRIDICRHIITENENKILNYKKQFREKYGETINLISNRNENN